MDWPAPNTLVPVRELVRAAALFSGALIVIRLRILTPVGSQTPRRFTSRYIGPFNSGTFHRERMTILTVKHVTTYSYGAPVRLGEHRMMLRPRDSNDQRLLDATLDIEPRPQNVRWIHDVFDNCVAIANFTGNTRSLRVESNIALEHTPFEGPEVSAGGSSAILPVLIRRRRNARPCPIDRAALRRSFWRA